MNTRVSDPSLTIFATFCILLIFDEFKKFKKYLPFRIFADHSFFEA